MGGYCNCVAGLRQVLLSVSHVPVPHPYSAALTPQCADIKATKQKCMQTLRHSKEQLNRLNQAIQWVTVEVDRAMSQVRGGSGGRQRGEWWEGVHYLQPPDWSTPVFGINV